MGLDHADDAGVYKISDDLALIQTVDFFTPVVDDPYDFGRIAAANALSDIYAMGGVPKTALNLVAFPVGQMDLDILRQILLGGLEKMKEAGVVVVGGHSVEDKELKYGLSVTGFVHPDQVLIKKNIRVGDRLILTKPLGTGIINTAIKGGLASPEVTCAVTELMAGLNKTAAEIMARYPVHACTDITGFGLLGHIAEMVGESGPGVVLYSESVPIIPEAPGYADMGMIPGGTYKNREFREHMVKIQDGVSRSVCDIMFDPQTSGGLLISVSPGSAEDLLVQLKEAGISQASVIGEVVAAPENRIEVR